jgi:hypothetical protein
MRFKDAIRQNSFAAYFQCENTKNCCVITKDGGEMVELMMDRSFIIEEISNKRILITVLDKIYILEDALRSLADAKGTKSWLSNLDDIESLVK